MSHNRRYLKLDLTDGKHTVKVTVDGLAQDAKDAGVTSPKVCFDYYEVTVGGEENQIVSIRTQRFESNRCHMYRGWLHR
ncbi:MAG: hypothetical protein ACLTCI_02265 [[Clostridium] nexile]